MSTSKPIEVILGVDTHLDIHVGVLINGTGQLLGKFAVETRVSGYLKLLAWAQSFGSLQRAGVEGTGTYGAGLTQVLREHQIAVFEVNRPDRSKRRLEGKSDPADAESAARSVLSGSATAVAKTRSGAAEAMKETTSMRIGDVAKRTSVSVDALRFYEEKGLIKPQRTANGYRLYPQETLQLVGYIKLAQQLGFSLAQIGENLPLLWSSEGASSDLLAELFAEKIVLLDERIAQMLALRNVLAERAAQVCPLLAGDLNTAM